MSLVSSTGTEYMYEKRVSVPVSQAAKAWTVWREKVSLKQAND